MKRVIPLFLFFPMLLLIHSAYAEDECALQRQAILEKREQAITQGNYYIIAGLEKTYRDINVYCSREALLSKANTKVTKIKRKMLEKQSDINAIIEQYATKQNDRQKRAKYERKLAEKKRDYAKLQLELDEITEKIDVYSREQ